MKQHGAGTKVSVPATEWGEDWARGEHGDQWNTARHDGEVVRVKSVGPKTHLISYGHGMEEWMEWWRVDKYAVGGTESGSESEYDDSEGGDEGEMPSDSSDDVPLVQLRKKPRK